MTDMNTEPLLKRVFMFLEDGDWKSADEYCERVLDMDPENPMAYLGKLLAQMRVRTKSFEENPNYKKLLRYCHEGLAVEINNYLSEAKENARRIRSRRVKRLAMLIPILCAVVVAAVLILRDINNVPTWEKMLAYRSNMTLEEIESFAKKAGFEKVSIEEDDNNVFVSHGNWYGSMDAECIQLFFLEDEIELEQARDEIEDLCGEPVLSDYSSGFSGTHTSEWYAYRRGSIEICTLESENGLFASVKICPGVEIP